MGNSIFKKVFPYYGTNLGASFVLSGAHAG
jgi:hypothetical protein